MTNKEQLPELRDWHIATTILDGSTRACGFVYNDPQKRFADGTWITTSRIVGINTRPLEGEPFVLTKNTRYILKDRHSELTQKVKEQEALIARLEKDLAIATS